MQGLCRNEVIVFILDFSQSHSVKDVNEIINFINQSLVKDVSGINSPFPEYVAILYNPKAYTMNFCIRAYRSIDLFVTTPKFSSQITAMTYVFYGL